METNIHSEMFSDEIQKTINYIFLEKNKLIEKAYNEGADWICFNIKSDTNNLIIESQMFKDKIKNPNKWSEIFDLKKYREQVSSLNCFSIDFEKVIKNE